MAFPLRFDGRGQTAESDGDAHIHELIEQVLFTAPGERVNQPEFGSGALQLVFAPGSDDVAATTQFLVRGALQQWLGDVVDVQDVDIQTQDGILLIRVTYASRQSQQPQTVNFVQGP
ncbi:MAG TPA: GPW/gp25 family protein [Streptosporangiaceae bacterium]